MADGLATYKKMRNKFQNVCFLSLENTEGSQSHIPTSPKDQSRKRKTILPWLLGILWFDLPWSFLNFPDERCEKMREKQRLMAIGDQQSKRDMRTAKRGITRGWLYCWTQQCFYSKKFDMFLVSAELRNHTDFRGPSNENYKEDQWNTKNWLFYVPWLVVDTLWGSSKSKGRAVAGSKIRRIRAAFWLWCP